jgi:hypothetical protein
LRVERRNDMEALHDTSPQIQGREALIALRQRASLLVSQSESEELLAEAVAILSGRPLPCTYTHEQMEASLREEETDYQNGRFVSQSTICERYGI